MTADGAIGEALGQSAADIRVMAKQRVRLAGSGTAFRATEMLAFGTAAREGFAGALGDEVTFNLRGECKSESEDFGLDVIAEPIAILNRPDTTAALHAEAEDFHYHKETAAKAAEFTTDNKVAAVRAAEKST